jgi:hypothetical protein
MPHAEIALELGNHESGLADPVAPIAAARSAAPDQDPPWQDDVPSAQRTAH